MTKWMFVTYVVPGFLVYSVNGQPLGGLENIEEFTKPRTSQGWDIVDLDSPEIKTALDSQAWDTSLFRKELQGNRHCLVLKRQAKD